MAASQPSAEIEVPASSFRSLVSPDELQRLRQPVPWRVWRDLGLIWLQIVASVAIYLVHPAWWTFALAFVGVAGGQHGLMLATHEFSHYSLFPNDRRLNDWLGTWLFGGPSGIPLRLFRHRHFKHHRTYSTADDPKTVYRHDVRGWGLARELARSLSGWEFVSHLLEARAQEAREVAAGRPTGPAPAEVLPPLVVAQAVLFGLFSLVASPWLYFTLWLLPLVTLSHWLQKWRALMEHRPPEIGRGGAYYGGTPGPFVRTVRASWWERLLVSKLNFGFHAEHHLWPQVAYQHLPALRERLERAGAFADPRFGREDTYLSTLLRLWRAPRDQDAAPEPGDAAHALVRFRREPVRDLAKQAVPRCPACDSPRRHERERVVEHEYTTTTSDEFPLQECEDCGAWYLDPRPDASTLGVIYPPNYYAYVQDAKVQGGEKTESTGLFARLGSSLFKRRIAPITKYIALGPDKRWLDIGCGNGSVLQSMKEAYGVDGTGLDLSQDAVAFCRKRGFQARAGRFEEYQPDPGEAYDLVHSSHVIEHVESPYAYLRKTYELLRPGGISVFITPNTATWEARRFGRHWGGLHVPRHWTLLDPGSARKLAERAGFEHLETSFSTNGTFWTWTFHSLLRGRIPDRWNDALFPSDYRFIENNAWNILRIGLFTVFDVLNLVFTKQSSNMLVILRKPHTAPAAVTPAPPSAR